MSNNKPHNSSSTDEENVITSQDIKGIQSPLSATEAAELIDRNIRELDIHRLFSSNLGEKFEKWYAERCIKQDEESKKELALKFSSNVINLLVSLIDRDINSFNKTAELEDFEQKKDQIKTFVKGLDLSNLRKTDDPNRSDNSFNFESNILEELVQATGQVIDNSIISSQIRDSGIPCPGLSIARRIERYLYKIINTIVGESFIPPLIPDEKEQSGSSDQKSEETVLDENSLMDLPDEEFLREMNRLQNLILDSPSNRYLSMEENDEILYQYKKAKNRGELNTIQEEQEFTKKLLHEYKIPFELNPFTKEMKDRFRRLVIPRILNPKNRGT